MRRESVEYSAVRKRLFIRSQAAVSSTWEFKDESVCQNFTSWFLDDDGENEMTIQERREMLIKWKRSIWLDFFFFFPSSPLDSLDRFSDCRQGQFPRSDFSLFRSVRSVCVSVCVCLYTLINLPDERVVNVVQSTKHRSRTSNSFQYWINGYILPTVCHRATTKRTKEKKKRGHHHQRVGRRSQFEKRKNKKVKKKSRPGRLFGSAWPRQHWLSHDHTGAPHPACERAIGSPIDLVIAFFSYSNLTVFFFFFF